MRAEYEGFQSEEEVGFLVPRCVRKPQQNILYMECYEAIRRYHPDLKIIFIDDNSDKEILEDYPMTNVEVIHSEYPGAGEYLCYWYMLNRRPFKKAIFLQDSMILTGPIPYEGIIDYMFLYEFPSVNVSSIPVTELLKNTTAPEELLAHCKGGTWKGCWGSMMVVTSGFIDKLEDKLQISKWVTVIHDREYRMALESAIGVACTFIQPKDKISMFGLVSEMNVMRNPGNEKYTLEMYLEDKNMIKDNIIKIWNGR